MLCSVHVSVGGACINAISVLCDSGLNSLNIYASCFASRDFDSWTRNTLKNRDIGIRLTDFFRNAAVD